MVEEASKEIDEGRDVERKVYKEIRKGGISI